MGVQRHLPFRKSGLCSRCGRPENDDGSNVTWRCAVCEGLVCRHCALTAVGDDSGVPEYLDVTMCSKECWSKGRVVKGAASPADPLMKVVHLVTQRGQPYGSHRCCCEVCGVSVMPPRSPLWTDDLDMWWNRKFPPGHIRCDDMEATEKEVREVMES